MRFVEVEPGVVRVRTDGARPRVGPADVRVSVLACGICGTDLHLRDGIALPPGSSYPVRPGHEICGEVAEVGSAVTSLAVGSIVVLHPLDPCGRCDACELGEEQRCAAPRVLGVTAPGGMAEEVVWPAARTVPAGSVPPEQAAVLADAVATAYRALATAGVPRQGALCVIGAGGVGSHVLQLARALDPDVRLAAVVRSEASAARVTALGVQVCLGLAGARRTLLEDIGEFDAVVDFSGAAEGPLVGLRLLRKGGRLVLGAVDDGPLELGRASMLVTRELEVRGTYSSTLADLVTVTALARDGTLDLGGSVTHRMPLDRAAEAFDTVSLRPPGMVRLVLTV